MPSHQTLLKQIHKIISPDTSWIVGGAIRDRLQGRKTMDYDLVVLKNPKKIAGLVARKLRGSSFVLDEKRQVYRVSVEKILQFDFARTLEPTFNKDLDRRDFSINQLAVKLEDWPKSNWKSKILDRHHGLQDFKKKKIRALSRKNLIEDPLRLLRAFRIAAELQFSIDPATLKNIQSLRTRLKKPSPERIREELLKMFSQPDASTYLKLMDKTQLLDVLLPEAKLLRQTASRYYGKGGVLKHTLGAVQHLENIIRSRKSWFPKCHLKIQEYLNEKIGGYPRLAHLKWGTLLHDLGKPDTAKILKGRLRFFNHEYVGADQVLKMSHRYRWSKEETQQYSRLVRHHMRPGNLATHENVTPKAIHRFFRDLGDDAIGMLLVSLGDHLTYLSSKELKKRNSAHERLTIKMINLYYKRPEKVLPPRLLSGFDIMNYFKLKPSPLIGSLLKDLQEAQSEKTFKNKRGALSFLKQRLGRDKAQ